MGAEEPGKQSHDQKVVRLRIFFPLAVVLVRIQLVTKPFFGGFILNNISAPRVSP